MRMNCPACERPTFYPERVGNDHRRAKNVPEGMLIAVIMDGSCAKCRRIANGKTRLLTKGTTIKREVVYHHAMTEADIEAARIAVMQFEVSRLARGIPVDGLDPETLHRSGLSLMEA